VSYVMCVLCGAVSVSGLVFGCSVGLLCFHAGVVVVRRLFGLADAGGLLGEIQLVLGEKDGTGSVATATAVAAATAAHGGLDGSRVCVCFGCLAGRVQVSLVVHTETSSAEGLQNTSTAGTDTVTCT